MTPAQRIESAAADATVARWGTDAVWVAPTAYGATLRASRCLARGDDPAAVSAALALWSARP